jgi:hypothetical protein
VVQVLERPLTMKWSQGGGKRHIHLAVAYLMRSIRPRDMPSRKVQFLPILLVRIELTRPIGNTPFPVAARRTRDEPGSNVGRNSHASPAGVRKAKLPGPRDRQR